MKLGYSIYEKIFHWAFIVNKCLEIKKQTTANIMTQDLLRFEKWYAPSMKELSISSSKTPKQKPSATVTWRNFKGELSPVDAYKYLKARFGAPNGITMIGKQQSLDNLIHWHYTIFCEGYRMDYFGHSNGMEIIFSHPDKDIMDIKREIFILAMKGEFRNHSKAIADVQRGFETWTLFVNPFVRLSQTIDALIADLKKLTLDEPVTPHVPSPRSAYEEYSMQLEVWSKNITKSAAIGTTIRMLLPVRAESFINLILYICRKREFIEDERLYEGLIRNPIDIRVKSLHMNCDGFSKAVNGKDSRFLVFHTMMNKRNDFLHGNINPSNQKIETVYIDGAFTPLFHDDESIFKKMISKYAIGVSEKEVQQDVQVVADLIELVLECLDPPTRIKIESLMNERFPGIREIPKKFVVLFPTNMLKVW